MKKELKCPKCGTTVEKYRNPTPTVDIVIYERERGIVSGGPQESALRQRLAGRLH